MLGTLKITQGNNKDTWKNVPLQDFRPISEAEEHSDPLYRNLGTRIDWSRSISEIDRQLYKKYALSDEEINFIEQRVKEMV